MSWLSHPKELVRAVSSRAHAVQRHAAALVAPRSLRLARAGVLRVITVVAGH